jgi:hypothetical protein
MRWVGPVAVVVGALVLPLLQQELFGWCYWLAERLVRRAVRCLPQGYRERYELEWLAELGQLRDRNLWALLWALGVLAYAPSVGRGLRNRPASPYRLVRASYIAAVAAVGLGLGGWLLAHGGAQAAQQARGPFLLVLLVAVGVQLRQYVSRSDNPSGFTVGSVSVALVAGWGVAAGAPAAALAAMIGDLGQRRSAVKALFNGGQYVLCVAAAGWTCGVVREQLPQAWGELAAVIAAGVLFTTLNSLFVRVVLALHQPTAMARELREGWAAEALTCLAMIVAAPFVLLVLKRSPAFLPLLLLPEAILPLVFRRLPSLGLPPAQEPPASALTSN